MKTNKATDAKSSAEKRSESGNRKKSTSGSTIETATKTISNKFSSRVHKKFSSSFSISSLLAANKNEDNHNQQLQQQEKKQKQDSAVTPTTATENSLTGMKDEEFEPIRNQKLENAILKDSSPKQNEVEGEEEKKNIKDGRITAYLDSLPSAVQPLSVDALSNTICSTKSATVVDVGFESLKSITTNAASTHNNLLIPVSSLPTNIIAALPLPESVRKSLNVAVSTPTEIPSDKSPKKENEQELHSLFSLDKFGEIIAGKNDGIVGKRKKDKEDFEDDEIEVDVDCVEGVRLSSDSDNSNEDDDEDGEFEEDGSGGRKKKTRTVFSRTQVGQLETMFDLKRYLSSSERSTLARDLGLSEQQIKIWFQNRRNKLKRQIKTGLEMTGNINAGTVPPPNVNAALLNSHSLSMGSIGGTGHHHHHSFLPSSFNAMSSLFPAASNSTPTGVSTPAPGAGLTAHPSVATAGHALGSASLMSSMLPGMNFHSNPVNTFNQHLHNPFFHRPPIASSFGPSATNTLLSPPSANQSASLFSSNQSISITPFPSSSSAHNSSQTNPSQSNFSYPNLQLFKSLSGLV